MKRKIQILLFFYRDKNKKKWLTIIKEFLTLSFTKKGTPFYYISNLLYRKNVTNYKDYLSLDDQRRILKWSYTIGQDHIELARNKLLFERLLLKNNISTPQIYFYNSGSTFTYKGNNSSITNKNDLCRFLEQVFSDEETNEIFCKPIDAGMGVNIFKLNKNSFDNISESIVSKVLLGSYIFQENVIQHNALKAINSSSLNTMRIATYKNTDSNVIEILAGFIRVGREGAIIDNAHAGGIVLPIDMETGKLGNEGLQLIDNGGGIFYEHPDSGIVFNNYQIPYFDQVKQIVTKASLLFDIPLMGWDVALTPSGPVIIEVNHDFHLLLTDRMAQGLRRNTSFQKLVDNVVYRK